VFSSIVVNNFILFWRKKEWKIKIDTIFELCIVYIHIDVYYSPITNDYPSPQIIELLKKTTIYADWNPGPGLWQAQKCGRG
jgi:hypothetical protein